VTTFQGGIDLALTVCIKNVGGLTENDLLAGVKVGGSDTTWPASFEEGVTVLSYCRNGGVRS
jgi:hypothetical protein